MTVPRFRSARNVLGWSASSRNGTLRPQAASTSIDCNRMRLAEAGPAFVESVKSIVGEDRFDETFVDVLCEPPRVFTDGGVITHVLTFAAHRRTLVCGALVDAGITDLGAGDPMHWVAEPR